MRPVTHALIGAVHVYQWTIRPIIGANCRFEPSCSHYAIGALGAHGAIRGSGLAAWRILRCNPWNEGGDDPVPPAKTPNAPPFAPSTPDLSPQGRMAP